MTIVAEATRLARPAFRAPVIEGELVPVDLDALQRRITYTVKEVPAKPSREINWPLVLTVTAYTLGLSIIGVLVYGIVQIVLAVARAVEEFGHWMSVNGPHILGIGALALLALLFCGGSAAKCAGIHCGGCRG